MAKVAEFQPSGQPWQLVLESSKERLQYLYNSGQYSDLDMNFSEADGRILKVHRLVLAMSSPVFGAMLMGNMAEGKQLCLQDPPEAMKKLLDYMYLDTLELESVPLALQVYGLAHKYQMDAAKQLCSQYIASHLTEETTLPVLEASQLYEDEAMNRECLQVLNQNPDDVMASKAVSEITKATLKDLLQKELKVSSEVVMWKGVIAWGKAQLLSREETPTGTALRKEVEDLLRDIRFLTMSCEEFIDSVIGEDVLNNAECIQILRAIRGVNAKVAAKTLPISPAKRKRGFFEGLACADLSKVEIAQMKWMLDADNDYVALLNLSTSENILVHSMTSNYDGKLKIVDKTGIALHSATSDENKFTFSQPFLLEEGKKYDIKFSLRAKHEIAMANMLSSECTDTVSGVTLTFSNNYDMNFKLFFSRE